MSKSEIWPVEYQQLTPGDILKERYRILELIGRGGMGAVYQAEDLRLEGRLTAIKEIILNFAESDEQHDETRRQFQREASTLARLDHPTLPKVSDFFVIDGRDFLVMDYIPGNDLRQVIEEAIIKQTFIAEKDLLNWANQIAEALIYLHSQVPPILHRDIKPANIKITPNGFIKVVDFGLVKLLNPDEESRTITVVQGRGSVHYTPLEQYGGDAGHTDIRSDVYAFSATLYHLATNRPPLEAKQRFLAPRALQDPRDFNTALSERAAQAILWGMAMHPDQRPKSIQELREALLTEGKRIPYRVRPGLRRADSVQQVIVYDPDLAKGNVVLAVLATLLLIVAIFVTFYSPIIS
jgi:serine/threonine-protein kinase